MSINPPLHPPYKVVGDHEARAFVVVLMRDGSKKVEEIGSPAIVWDDVQEYVYCQEYSYLRRLKVEGN